MIAFFVPGLPKPKGSKNAFVIPGRSGARPRAVLVDQNSHDLKSWAHSVSAEARLHAPDALIEGPVEMRLMFYVKAPKSLRKTVPSFATKKPDLDKLTRAVWDSLSGVLYRDDSQVIQATISKQYGDQLGVQVQLCESPYGSVLGYTPGVIPSQKHIDKTLVATEAAFMFI